MFWIRGRKVWGAKPPRGPVTRDAWDTGVTLVVHHTAGAAPNTHAGALAEMRNIQHLHMSAPRGWNDVGYNYVITPQGIVLEGRGWGVRGAHTQDHNTGTIGVSFMGNCDVHRPTARQLVAYRLLLAKLRIKGAKIRRIKGHRQMPDQSTACPGRYLMSALKL